VFPTFTILGIVLSCVSNLSVATAVTFEIFPATKLVYFFLVAALVCAKLSQPLKPKTERAGLVMRTRPYTSKQATTTSFQQQLRSTSSQSQIGCPVIDWHQLRGWESPARTTTARADWPAFAPRSSTRTVFEYAPLRHTVLRYTTMRPHA
jgi:hypothetical protein